MFGKPVVGKGPFFINLIFNIATLVVAIMVVSFMNDLAKDPRCKVIDPITREGLNGYSMLIIGLTCLSLVGNLYVIFLI